MLTLPTSRVFTATSSAASAVFVAAAILSTVPRASQAYYPCNYESVATSDERHVEQELRNHGRITSPGYPEAFPPCAQGMWSLMARPNCTVLLNFVEFNVANFTDRLFVYEMDDAPRVAAEISGEASNLTLQLDASNVQLVFLAQTDDPLTDGRPKEDGSAPPPPRRRFVIDFTSWSPENASKSEQSAIDRNGDSPDAPPAAGLSSSEASWKARKASKLFMTVFVTLGSLVFSAITLGAVYFILWRRTGHLFSYQRFFGSRNCSTAELRSDSATSIARRETNSSPATSTVDLGCGTDAPNFLGIAASSSASPCARPPPPRATLATTSV